jgi:hypothetical protein
VTEFVEAEVMVAATCLGLLMVLGTAPVAVEDAQDNADDGEDGEGGRDGANVYLEEVEAGRFLCVEAGMVVGSDRTSAGGGVGGLTLLAAHSVESMVS